MKLYNSTNVLAMSHSRKTNELVAVFHNGKIYTYKNVPRAVFRKVDSSKSIGRAFNKYIKKGGYAYEMSDGFTNWTKRKK